MLPADAITIANTTKEHIFLPNSLQTKIVSLRLFVWSWHYSWPGPLLWTHGLSWHHQGTMIIPVLSLSLSLPLSLPSVCAWGNVNVYSLIPLVCCPCCENICSTLIMELKHLYTDNRAMYIYMYMIIHIAAVSQKSILFYCWFLS